ncbi:pirin [Colletotrichum graminicola]|uniref:Pirin n=1 Tax=Colletotrichum graminicola (strain M1.001 / M2 / FGSC 10212) TaxID=645133 RepID=E3QI75_COLGM|nr:pirin [Colletotrichum graminicola M1.001]EFQ30690.1 pirin [Colletotrichum graminicola M1.001]WDK21427.1 pirin [Colletotrichum graminicola]
MSVSRAIVQVFRAPEQAEGAGARVRRAIGSIHKRNFSPFLMFDHMSGSTGAGFPDHPHRGQETISYILKGSVEHEDFAGNKGILRAGDAQFMTAGRGIMHSEQPLPEDDGTPGAGFQLWVDLPKHLKMCEPRYRDLGAKEIPQVQLDNGQVYVKVISGRSGGVVSVKDLAYTPVWFLDVEIKPGGKFTQLLPQEWNAFAYVFEGEAVFGSKSKSQSKGKKFDAVIFEKEGDVVDAEVPDTAHGSARLLLIAGQVLDQPIAQHGPFVMNSREELQQAVEDFYTHKNGFERAKDWRSESSKRKNVY